MDEGLSFFHLRVEAAEMPASRQFQYAEVHDELFLSPNGRLASVTGMAHFDSELLAHRFREANLPRLQQRYGGEVRLEVVRVVACESRRLRQRVEVDSSIARNRLESTSDVRRDGR